MEKIPQIKAESFDIREYLLFVDTVKKDVFDTFPFTTDDEKIEFENAIKKIEEHSENVNDIETAIQELKKALAILKNSHTKLGEIDRENSLEYTDNDRRRFVKAEILEDDIGYLKVKSWSAQLKIGGKGVGELVEEEGQKIAECPSLIIDVRGNGGGSSSIAEKLAGHFIENPEVYYKVLRRKDGSEELYESEFKIEPQGRYFDKKIVILTDSKCMSSNEMFVLMLKDTGKAITIGEKTGGGSGNPKFFNLSLGDRRFRLAVSTWIPFRIDGRPIEGVGVEADIPVEVTEEDKSKGRDPQLEKAIEYLNK